MGDLNHDGIPDLVVANNGNRPSFGSVTVLIGRGDGTFLPPVRYGAGKYPYSVALGDFNGDGNLDVAVTDGTGLFVLLGNGDGTLSSARSHFAGISPGSVVAADFNGDGRLDLATVNFIDNYNGQVSVLLGNGDGTFQPPRHFPQGGAGSTQMVAADFNADGKPDLATVNYSTGNISVLLNLTSFPRKLPAPYPYKQIAVTRSDGHLLLRLELVSSHVHDRRTIAVSLDDTGVPGKVFRGKMRG